MSRCLIVEDASVIRKVAKRILKDMQFTVSEAENGQEALERCQTDRPDLILLDWSLPVKSALEFLSVLKLTSQQRRPYVIYCTTENDVADISRALAAGADDYMMKPYNREMLEAKLAEMKAAA